MGKGQNYENHNVKNQKELRKLRRRSERRKCPSIFHKSDQNVKNKKTSTTYGVLPMVTKAFGGLG